MIDSVQNIKLGLIGYSGRMGQALAAHLTDIGDISITSRLEAGESIDDFIASQPDVVVDLSVGPAVGMNGPRIIKAHLPYIIGATAISDEAFEELRNLALREVTPVLVVPNFSLGANLMIRFAAAAATLMETPVITERHHSKKADAPSGTALFTAGRINAARPDSGGDSGAAAIPACNELHAGVMGAAVGSVAIHSLRGAGYMAEQVVSLTLPGESLTIEHRAIDRRCFMPGIIHAIRNIGRVRGLQVGLDTILNV